ncbi:dimethyl sulfoxide reductase anchor subunit family protein [Rhodobacter ferrooxidans]|uniref:DMSO reductase anchor subunit (DmsC) n=1 Tax=Rhodobacter ferrooxidans TaxID=371731 RepID=C8S352_9RHOB|nr:DmsC/YnfH family molybdoenzyme membrane anchor subunit [Rhodobacter sp. SW2]EEW24534.1 DMSO reductase anchor subunit (DmsC) [Rhodobacter sp. SW2]
MHPAPSVILFTVLSGLGFGFLAFLGAGLVLPQPGLNALLLWGLGYGLAVGGLMASTFHLGNPRRAWRAFSQWQSSWLSREAWASLAALLALAPVALSDLLGLGWPRGFGLVGTGLALITVATTSMIYTQLKTIPRWNHWTTPLMFVTFALAGGAILAGQTGIALPLLVVLALALLAHWQFGDRRFAEVGASLATATGLGHIGALSVFEPAHTADNYLLREMIYVVGRKHVQKLRVIALICTVMLPAVLLSLGQGLPFVALALLCHLAGAFAARWLFFAQAEHVVGLYYGKR